MYTAGTQNQNELNEDREAYLLGTKRIDKLLDSKLNNDEVCNIIYYIIIL